MFAVGDVVTGFGLHNAGRAGTVESVHYRRGTRRIRFIGVRYHLDGRLRRENPAWWKLAD